MIIKSFAKINLDFEILEKKENGYHELRSVFLAIDIYDLLTINKIERGYRLSGSLVCDTADNLITKSKLALESIVGRELPCEIHLIKSLPICAGLGGGSSNAAATIIGLNELFKLNLSDLDLATIASTIGSDIPFFVKNIGTAFVTGVGEKVEKIEKNISNYYLIARPHKRLNTREMFKLFDETKKSFFEIASEIWPDVKTMHDYLSSKSLEVGMSGSGPTLFAGFDDFITAQKTIENYGVLKFNGDFFICRPVNKTYEIIK